jgi:26S proteasome regulatory subunit N10
MRNGDFSPSRFEAQQDACNLVCGKKTSANMENAVGLIATAGKSVEVCVSLTQDLGKILSGLHKVQIGGQSDLITAIQIASLALRHRQNKRQEQRIVVFVGSLVTASDAELKRLGAQLKKNKIAVDIVSFGENCAEENRPKLEALNAAVNNHDNSYFVTLPPGEHMLSQMIASTPIVRGADAGPPGAPGAPAANNFDDYGGVDPNVDPELAMALRLSLESAENERKAREPTPAEAASGQPPAASTAPAPAPAAAPSDAMDVEDMDEDLRAAIALSLQSQPSASTTSAAPPPSASTEGGDAMDVEDEDLKLALQMSKQTAVEDSAKDANKEVKKEGKKIEAKDPKKDEPLEVDPNYMASVLLNLPGMDPNDPEVQKILQQMQGKKDDQDEKK